MLTFPLPLDRRDWLIACGLAALLLLTGSMRMAPRVCGVYHDDAIYVSTARALAAGDGYRLTGVPGAPLQTKYPILYPAVLAAVCYVWPTFPDNLLAMQIITLASAAGAVAATYLYCVRFRYASREVAAAGCALCATAPLFLYFCAQTMAELPFLLLTVVALWALDEELNRSNSSRWRQAGLGVLLALPFLCRTIGAAVLVAGVFVLWQWRRPVRWSVAGAAAAALPWVLWSLIGRGIWDRSPILGYYTDYAGCWSSTGIAMLDDVFVSNAERVAFGTGEMTCQGLATVVTAILEPALRTPLLIAVGVIPWLMMARPLRQARPLPCALAAYLLLILVWSWPPQRFLVPILPFLSVFLLSGTAALVKRVHPRFGLKLAAASGFALLMLANVALLARHAERTDRTGYPLRRASDSPVAWAPFQRSLAWLQRNSSPHDIVASCLDSMVSLHTGRAAFRPFVYNPDRLFYSDEPPQLMTVEELVAILRRHRPRYVLHTPIPGFAEEELFDEVLNDLRQQYPGWLVVVHQDEDPRFIVFELDARHEPAVNDRYPVGHIIPPASRSTLSASIKNPSAAELPRGVGFKSASRVMVLAALID